MSKHTHTPGPWWATDHGVRDVGGYIAHTNSVQRYEGQDERYAFEVARREADKRLIAAAPELLDALQELCDIVQNAIEQKSAEDLDSFTLQPARAAIATATQEASHE